MKEESLKTIKDYECFIDYEKENIYCNKFMNAEALAIIEEIYKRLTKLNIEEFENHLRNTKTFEEYIEYINKNKEDAKKYMFYCSDYQYIYDMLENINRRKRDIKNSEECIERASEKIKEDR